MTQQAKADANRSDPNFPESFLLLTFEDREGGYWYPRARSPRHLGEIFEKAHYGADDLNFRLWDIDADGTPQECEVEWNATTYTDNDYAHAHGRVVRKDSREYITDVFTHIDLRA
jgi:hypothetical protein